MVLFTMIFGGVPVSVSKPPVLEPKAIGINNLEGSVPMLHADAIVTGISVATVPVLLTTPESSPEPKVVINKSRVVLFLANLMNFSPAKAVHPVCDNPSPTMNNAAIMITVGLLKPERVSFRSNIPKRNKLNMDNKAIMSGVNLPQINRAIVIDRMTSIKLIE